MKKQTTQQNNLGLPDSTLIEVVAIKGNTVIKKIMTIEESMKLKKKSGWNYYNYQIGYCSIK